MPADERSTKSVPIMVVHITEEEERRKEEEEKQTTLIIKRYDMKMH